MKLAGRKKHLGWSRAPKTFVIAKGMEYQKLLAHFKEFMNI